MNELRQIGRAASAMALLALLAAALALHALRDAHAGPLHAAATLAGSVPVVTSLQGGGAADRAGLRVGDVVEAIDGRAPRSLADVERVMASGKATALRIRRDGRELDVTLR